MSNELLQFHQVFFEETAEHLNEMEKLLLSIDLESPSDDELNAIFRAAHSIKGNSATFGFTDMTEVTHILESLLDRLRKHEVRITRQMVDVFLESVDVLRDMLKGHQHGVLVDVENSKSILVKLREITDCEIGGGNEKKGRLISITYRPENINSINSIKEKLITALNQFGELEISGGEDNNLFIKLNTQHEISDINEAFSFYAQRHEYSITKDGENSNPGLRNESAEYGFFENESELFENPVLNADTKDDGYGLFSPELSQQVVAEQENPIKKATENSESKYGRRSTDRPGVESASIRVGVDKVDQLINLVGELVITQAMLTQTANIMSGEFAEKLSNGLSQLERNTRDLQESVMSIRMMPISMVFSRFPRLVRDLANKLGKEVELQTIGEGTELDKGLLEKISDPLTHLVRNSLDHGIELPEVRAAKGKPEQGKITLQASHQGGNIVISVTDDGAGLNREKILQKAVERGLSVSQEFPDSEIWQLIFEPGFSTAEVITDVSGRGVGMDVVKKNITALNGKIEIESEFGRGTTITIRLPLTLAILDGMSIAVGDQLFILPLAFITESMQPKPEEVRTITGNGTVIHVRGEYLPLIPLHHIFGISPKVIQANNGIVVLVESDGKKVALLVDELVSQHQVVIKSLEANYRKVDYVSAATIMGDGTVALILDVSALTQLANAKDKE